MTDLPPEAAGPQGDAPASEAVEAIPPRVAPPVTPSLRAEERLRPGRADRPERSNRGERRERVDRFERQERGGDMAGPRPFLPVRSSNAPVELTLDLLGTPPDKVLARVFGALERISSDVTLFVLLRDTPEYVGVAASVYQALRGRGYASDSSRFPGGGQRLRIYRRGEHARAAPRFTRDAEPVFAPAPEVELPPTGAPSTANMDEPLAVEPPPGLDSAKLERTGPPGEE
jgi:hypothetical protein